MSSLPILIRNNGPLFISAEDAANLRITDHTGALIALPEGKGITLCRCGLSKRKPFCDASHREHGWDGTLAPTVFAQTVSGDGAATVAATPPAAPEATPTTQPPA